VSYTNFRKEYPGRVDHCFKQWISFHRYWSGRLWLISIRHHQITLDFRLSWLDDLAFPDAKKEDRKAVDDAING